MESTEVSVSEDYQTVIIAEDQLPLPTADKYAMVSLFVVSIAFVFWFVHNIFKKIRGVDR